MKNDALVLNKLNINTVFVKSDGASIVKNIIEEDRQEYASCLLAPIDGATSNVLTLNPNHIRMPEASAMVHEKVAKDIIAYTSFAPARKEKLKIRYVKDCCKGSTSNTGSHWCEIQVYNSYETNVAKSKPYSVDGGAYATGVVTDGVFNTSYISGNTSLALNSVIVDLGEVYEDIQGIRISHYPDGRSYYKTSTWVSEDAVDWICIYDSDTEGTYTEVANGKLFRTAPAIKELLPSFSEPSQNSCFTTNELRHEFITTAPCSLSVDSRTSLKVFEGPLTAVSAKSIFYDETVLTDVVSVLSKDKRQQDFSVVNRFKQAKMIVATKVPVDTGNGSAAGDGLQNLNLELQPLSYVNIKLDFSTFQVESIVGLPPGLKLENGAIKGSPVISGDYQVKLLLNNGTYIPGQIKVHVLDRKL